jgi:hypothetical protein
MNLRQKLNNLLFILFSAIALSTEAQTLFEFSDSNLTAFSVGEKVYGFFDARQPKGIQPNFSCIFFFESIKKSNNEFTLKTFYTEKTYDDRDKESDINGALFIQEDKWIIHTNEFHGGCASGVGDNFIADFKHPHPAVFDVVKKSPAFGVYTLMKKSFFHKKKSRDIYERKSTYLLKNDNVIVLDRTTNFSYVQFSNPETSKKTSGWIQNSDLINPFYTKEK